MEGMKRRLGEEEGRGGGVIQVRRKIRWKKMGCVDRTRRNREGKEKGKGEE